MSKKRKAEELAGAEAAEAPRKKALDSDTLTTHSEPAEKTKKSKKRKATEALEAEPAEKPHKKSKKSKDPVSEQPAKEQPSTNDDPKPEATSGEADSALTAGEKRQAKSERPRRNKKGKVIHTREMALERNRLVQEKKKARKEQLKLARLVPAPTTNPAVPNQPDAIAAGSDYVPLFTLDTNPTPVNLDRASSTEPQKMIMLPKRSKKGLTKADRKAKAEANRTTQKERTAKRKEKKLRKDSVVNPNPLPEDTDPSTLLPPPTRPSTATTTTDDKQKPNHRFILFIGNLPFTTTTESLETHFASLQPFTVRHSTDKITKKSKGFAFLEFENFDKMKTCLSLYHHSYFNPENPGADPLVEDDTATDHPSTEQSLNKSKDKGRRINVELTAGGGGKGKDRKEKITKKNQKLAEQRERKAQTARLEKLKEDNKKAAKPVAATGANAEADTRGDIHPSRMSRVKG